jgi:hypothetical protein
MLTAGVYRRVLPTLVIVAALAIAMAPDVSVLAATTTLTVSGYVFRDLDNDGIRDANEPGVPGIRVRHGGVSISATTGSDGHYSLTGLPASGNILVETGWLRSQCPASGNPGNLNCPAGPGPDNDYATVNQFLQYPLSGTQSASNIDTGLLPDWPGDGLLPPAPPIPANSVDVAARLSWVSDTCVSNKLNICRAGDKFVETAQVYNQGTTPLTGISAILLIPQQDCLTKLALVGTATAPAITGLAVSPSTFGCGTRSVRLTFAGSLVAAGAIRVRINATTRTGPGTPGCDPSAPVTSTCSDAEPQGAGWLLAVDHIDQSGDPDSNLCAASGQPRRCPTGVHDKRRNPDEVDPVGHNVTTALGTITGFDMEGYLAIRSAPSPAHPGDTVVIRAWAGNQTDGQTATQVNPGSTLTLYLPSGTGLGALPVHALFSCTSGQITGAVKVTCRFIGPLSPGLSGPALDITATIAPSWPAGSPFAVVACAVPPAGQAAAERIPAQQCGSTTDPAATATNNDARIAIATG